MNLPVEPATFALFALAVLVLVASPGPTMAFLLAHAAVLGWRGGAAAACGVAAADLAMTVLTAAGLSAALLAWPPSLELLRYGGALYLLRWAWLGWRRPAQLVPPAATLTSLGRVVGRALLNSLLNPKALLFFLLFLPAFTQPERGRLGLQLALLGGTLTLVALLFHLGLAVLGAGLAQAFAGSVRSGVWASRLLALLFLLLALRLLTMELP